jgi:uracil-DNA glycosylase
MHEIVDWRFPFGQPIQKVVQNDRTPKQVFVLGVYASAVHAKWTGVDGKNIVSALAVASEPYIFWKGDFAEDIIEHIAIPHELGNLSPATQQFNGPSGIALDEMILQPLGLERANAWLCDLVPHSCINPSQKKAIERAYIPIINRYELPKHSVPPVPSKLTDEKLRKEIFEEFFESEAKILILLGDQPIRWFLQHYDNRWKKLSDFGYDIKHYGQLWPTKIGERKISVLPLAHPRQIAKLGHSSAKWYNLHQEWLDRYASQILRS